MSVELIESLFEKMRHLEKMRNNLAYSQREVLRWWNSAMPFSDWSDRQSESLVAFKARFAEFQDHLASAMKLIANIEGEDTRMFTYVLNYMVQIEVLGDMRQWQQMRDLRNAATHDYSEADDVKAMHFDSLLQNSMYLFNVFESLKNFVSVNYQIDLNEKN